MVQWLNDMTTKFLIWQGLNLAVPALIAKPPN